jgi:hypothetical protein
MKKLITSVLLVIIINPNLVAQYIFFQQANMFFSQYVKSGKVDYAAINNNPEQLQKMVDEIKNIDLTGKSESFHKAFYINAYNVLAIQQVIEKYPINGPLQVAGFFDNWNHQVAGKEMTLDELEKKYLFPNFYDSRMHFALVCAADGCPPLASFAYQPDKIDKQLNDITRKALNDENFIRLFEKKEQVQLSQIFSWYRKDFLQNNDNIIAYINQYRDNKIPDDYKVKFYEYDWSLNEVN